MGLENLGENFQKVVFKDSRERIQEDLERVDFDLLRSIFEEIYSKAGLDPLEMDFIKKEDVEFFHDAFYYGANAGIKPVIDSETGEEVGERQSLNFNPGNFKFWMPVLKDTLRKRLHTLKLLVHEQVHVTQVNGYETHEDKDGAPVDLYFSGLTSNNEEWKRTRTAFNEGIVEKIADKVLEEYLRRSGNSKFIEDGYYQTYNIGRMLIDILIQKIHTYSGVPEDQVFNALVRASYDGQDIMDEDLFKDGGNEIQAFIKAHENISPQSFNIPKVNLITKKEKQDLVDLFSREVDLATYTDKYVLKFLKKYGTK